MAVSGAGAAAIACLDLMVGLGVQAREHLRLRLQGRDPRTAAATGKLDESKQRYCQKTEATHPGRRGARRRRLPGLLRRRRADRRDGRRPWPTSRSSWRWPTPSRRSAPRSPRPRARTASSPPAARTTRTRSTTSCASPYIFRGALDCGATKITEAMKLACVREIAALAKDETSDEVAAAYAGQDLKFGPDYLIPKPFDAAPDPAASRRRWPRPPSIPAWPRARSPTWTPTARSLTALRLPDRHVHAPGLRRRQAPTPPQEARRLRRGRGRARAARGAGGARRPAGPADPDRPPGGDRGAHRSAPACA